MKSAIVWLLRLLVGGALAWAAISKFLIPFDFFRALRGYALLPDPLLIPFTYLVPGLELVVAGAVITGLARRAGWCWALLLSVGFVAFVVSAWARGLDVACGCFGGNSPLSTATLLRSLIFLSLCLLGLVLDRPRVSSR